MSSIILLHGASSSGKSTIARALQTKIELPFWHISIDHLRDSGVLPLKRFQSGEFKWQDARKPFFDGFHASLAAYANSGNNLILEHILDTPGWLVDLNRLLKGHDILFVGVHCSLNTLETRERERGDRHIGNALRDYNTVHRHKKYDIEINSEESLDKNIDLILNRWRSNIRNSSFHLTQS